MVFELIENNYVAVVITLFLILFIITNNNFEKRTNLLFLLAAFSVLVLIIEEAWEAQLALAETYKPMRVILSTIGYTLRPMVPLLLVMLFKSYTIVGKILLSIPFIMNALISCSALFSGIAFSYTETNEFVRGPLGYTPFLVAGFYVVVLLTVTLQGRGYGGLMEAMIVSAIVLLAFLSTVMESLLYFQFIQNPSIATSITFYYLFLHSNRNNRDILTGALVRRRFYLDADKFRTSLTAVVSLDINNLKKLNDQYGHMEGDQALVAVAGAIHRCIGTKASLYRTGGDEFMILCYKMNEEKVEKLIADIRKELEKTKYQCAIGYATYSYQMDFELVCQVADRAMYENKREMKGMAATRQPKEISG